MRVLVTNASYWNTLAAVRSLGRRGYKVIVSGPRRASRLARHGVATWSRYCTRSLEYTDPGVDPERFAEDITEMLCSESIDVFCPIGIKEVMASLRYERELRPLAAIPFGPYATIARANNKADVLRLAEQIGIPIPRTREIQGMDGLESLDVADPIVVKTSVGAASQGVWMVHDPQAWPSILEAIRRKRENAGASSDLHLDTDRFVVQELIPGKVHDVCLLVEQGKVRASLTQERVRTVSLDGGAGHMNITTFEPVIADYASQLMKALDYHGPAQVEFIRDRRDGTYRLLEVNAKYWGTLALSVAAGVDFPFLSVQMALNRPFEDAFDYQRGLFYRWRFPGEVLSWARQRKQGASFRSLIARPPGPAKSDWRWDDPLPSLNQMLVTAWKLLTKSGEQG